MRRTMMLGLTILAGTTAFAQVPSGPPGVPIVPVRAKGPALDIAIDMARAAVSACKASGYKVTALVTDTAGETVVMLSGDGVPARTQMVAAIKAANILNFLAPGTVKVPAVSDPMILEFTKFDPAKGQPHQGAVALMAGPAVIGAMAVSGAPGADKDQACADAGLAKGKARLR